MDHELLNSKEEANREGGAFKVELDHLPPVHKSAKPVDFNLTIPGQQKVSQKKGDTKKEEELSKEGKIDGISQKYFSNATHFHSFENSHISSTQGLSIAPPPFQLKAENYGEVNTYFSSTTTGVLPIQRDTAPVPVPASRVNAPQAAPPQPADPVNKEKEDFLKGKYGPKSIIPGTGFGGFEAEYIPGGGNGTLNIRVRAAVRFTDGLSLTGGVVVANNPGLASIANKANRLNPKAKATFCASYQWTAAEKGSKVKEYQSRMTEVAKMWSGAHTFFIDKEDWKDVKAAVKVSIAVTGGDASFEKGGGTDHLQISAVKTPSGDAGKVGAFVEDKNKDNKIESELTVADELKEVKHLNYKVLFANNSAVLNAFEIGKIKFIANKFKDSDKNNISNKVQLIGRASSSGDGEANNKLAQKRLDAVFAQLKAFGMDGISTGRVTTQNASTDGADESPEYRSVDIIIGSGEKQNTLAHEMGHVFGLGDEYKDAGKLGDEAEHSKQSEAMGGEKVVLESNDSIMSNGNEVRQQHYATFGTALNTLTNNAQPWKIS